MKIGYPCINRSFTGASNRTFRLKSYTRERLWETVSSNLDHLQNLLEFNRLHGLDFFRITSDLVPFASHPVCTDDWGEHFRDRFEEIGRFIIKSKFRISMHPDQFTLINSKREDVFENSVRELNYHARVMDLMGLDLTARIQIHVGGVYGDRISSMKRFVRRFAGLDEPVRRRLTIENDDRSYSLSDCLFISRNTGIPVLFDQFHHRLLNRGESVRQAVESAEATWEPASGPLMVDYSSQEPGGRRGTHAETIDLEDFKAFIGEIQGIEADIMLEIKDKETSALKALRAIRSC